MENHKNENNNLQNIETSNDPKPIKHRKLNKYPLFKMSTEYENWTEEDNDIYFLPDQRLLLEQQMRQHIQIITQNYLQFYKHPAFDDLASEQKEFLVRIV